MKTTYIFIIILLLFLFALGYFFMSKVNKPDSVTEKSKIETNNQWIDVLINQKRRVAAEWEPAIGVVISWKLHVPHTLLQAIAKDNIIYLMVESEDEKAVAKKKIKSWNIPEDRVKYYIGPQGFSYSNSRDWASFSVFDKSGDFQFYDGVYVYPIADMNNKITSWEGDEEDNPDDSAFESISLDMGMKRTDLDISLTGGNMFFDGLGKLFSTEIYTKENEEFGYSKENMLKVLKDYLGVTEYFEVPNYEESGIQHIDVLMMMLDQERLLVKRVPSDHPSFERIEEIVKYLSTLTNSFGRPYKVLRIDTPPYDGENLANYTNALILNKHVYVPLFNIPGDEDALRTWREAMPGYKVLGFQYTDPDLEYGWSYTDALHCRTKQIYDPQMLHMVHKHIDKVVSPKESYEIVAYIRDYSKTGLVSKDLKLKWRLQGSNKWTEVLLNNTDRKYVYKSEIKGPSAGQTVEYYISAADNSGRSGKLPITAPANLYTFYIDSNSVIEESKK